MWIILPSGGVKQYCATLLELEDSQLGIRVAWPEEEKSVKETNLCFKPLSYIKPSLTWQASVHACTDAFWEKRGTNNPGGPLSPVNMFSIP